MTSHDLNRAFEAFAPTAEQEQAMLDRLLTEQKEVRPVNRIKKMTVVLVAAALMLMACAFTVVTGWTSGFCRILAAERSRPSWCPAAL